MVGTTNYIKNIKLNACIKETDCLDTTDVTKINGAKDVSGTFCYCNPSNTAKYVKEDKSICLATCTSKTATT
jgi:hypothetical protein